MNLKYTAVSGIIILTVLLCGCKHVDSMGQYSEASSEISVVSEEVSEAASDTPKKPSPKIEFYNDGKTVKAISGKWSENTVLDEDEAFSSIDEIKELLNIKNVRKELVISASHSLGDKMLYVFDKIYNNIRVYGSEVIISVNYEDVIPNRLESYLIPDSILQKTDFSENFSEEDIIQKYNARNVGKYIYAYTNPPVIIYIADVDGEEKIISAVTGEIIQSSEGF